MHSDILALYHVRGSSYTLCTSCLHFLLFSGCPVYKASSKSLSLFEILQICLLQNVPNGRICDRLPRNVSEDAVFVLDLAKVNHCDLTADDHGIYGSHSSPSEKVAVSLSAERKILSCQTLRQGRVNADNEDISSARIYQVRRAYSWHQTNGLRRTVVKVQDGSEFMRYAILQYKVGKLNSTATPAPHGNSKKQSDPHYKTKPSIIEKIKTLGKVMTPKEIVANIQSDAGGAIGLQSPSDIPRDRRQVYNALQKVPGKLKCQNTGPKKTPELSKLVMMMRSSDFLKDVSLNKKIQGTGARVVPNTFAATELQLHWIRTFCNGQSPTSQVGIDMTYNVGPFYVTAMTFPHPMFVMKRDSHKHPTIFLGLMTSVTKKTEDYRYLATNLSKAKIATLTYGTDGEEALEKAFEDVFPIEGVAASRSSIHLRCFEHVKQDMKMKLTSLNVPEKQQKDIIKKIIGCEFDGRRVKGLVDSEDGEFDERYEEIKQELPQDFISWLNDTRGRIRPLLATLRKCMLKPVRVAAGLGNPPNQYDNQRSEAFNRTLKVEAKKAPVDQVMIHDVVDERIVQREKEELTKAIYGMGEYRLASEYKSLQLESTQWFQMTREQREDYRDKVLGLATPNRIRKPAVTIEEIKHNLPMPHHALKQIWEKAASIIDKYDVIPLENSFFCVPEEENVYKVCRPSKNIYSCHCSTYKENGQLCQHIVVVGDRQDNLDSYLQKIEKDHNKSFEMLFNEVSDNAGHKPGARKRRGKNNVEKTPIVRLAEEVDITVPRSARFSEYFHNDEPFFIGFIKDYKNAKSCESCHNDVPRLFLSVPFDILFVHKERYEYPEKDENGKVIGTVVTKRKLAKRYYCIRKQCVLKRHPYFWIGRIFTPEDVKRRLTESHLQFLKEVMAGYCP